MSSALGSVRVCLDFGDLRQKLAAEPAIESKDLLNYTENPSPAETEPGKGKQNDHLFGLALQARELARQRISAAEKKVMDISSFLSALLPHSYLRAHRSLETQSFQFTEGSHSAFPF